jgi:hypothetical protein
MGKGSGRRPTDEKKYCEGHTRTLGEKKARKPGKTTYVWKDGALVEKAEAEQFFIGIDPAAGPDYTSHMNFLVDRARGYFVARPIEGLTKELGVPAKLLGAKT